MPTYDNYSSYNMPSNWHTQQANPSFPAQPVYYTPPAVTEADYTSVSKYSTDNSHTAYSPSSSDIKSITRGLADATLSNPSAKTKLSFKKINAEDFQSAKLTHEARKQARIAGADTFNDPAINHFYEMSVSQNMASSLAALTFSKGATTHEVKIDETASSAMGLAGKAASIFCLTVLDASRDVGMGVGLAGNILGKVLYGIQKHKFDKTNEHTNRLLAPFVSSDEKDIINETLSYMMVKRLEPALVNSQTRQQILDEHRDAIVKSKVKIGSTSQKLSHSIKSKFNGYQVKEQEELSKRDDREDIQEASELIIKACNFAILVKAGDKYNEQSGMSSRIANVISAYPKYQDEITSSLDEKMFDKYFQNKNAHPQYTAMVKDYLLAVDGKKTVQDFHAMGVNLQYANDCSEEFINYLSHMYGRDYADSIKLGGQEYATYQDGQTSDFDKSIFKAYCKQNKISSSVADATEHFINSGITKPTSKQIAEFFIIQSANEVIDSSNLFKQ